MELYLIRHGIAADPQAYSHDADRPLTPKGYKKTTQVAQQLQDKGLRFEVILTSPLVRARETATILKEVGLGSQVEDCPALAPNGDIQSWVTWLTQQQKYRTSNACLALVGHQPDLGNWAEQLVWGQSQDKLILKKAGVIGLTLPDQGTVIAYSQLFLLISPKWLL